MDSVDFVELRIAALRVILDWKAYNRCAKATKGQEIVWVSLEDLERKLNAIGDRIANETQKNT